MYVIFRQIRIAGRFMKYLRLDCKDVLLLLLTMNKNIRKPENI